ncbi:MAG TPA: phosphatase PAP2 family protein [Vicinamibacterales bacterium]|nr:phosphatase PAP2 family protein [Vicinamibacterales bacterium]
MRVWIAASLAFFVYVIAVAPLISGLNRRARTLAALGSLVGLAIAVAAHLTRPTPLLHDWLIPPVLLLLGYWTSGLLFAAPMSRVESALSAVDDWLEVEPAARATPRWLADVLEGAYAGVYLLVPVALVVYLAFAERPDPERFWTVILVTDYICFACLPWIQTRPPRALSAFQPWDTAARRFNLRLLGSTSIQANTFPSGHAAEGIAVALLVATAPWPISATIAIAGLLVSAGAVLGRYHYAADAFAGWAVAVVVWMLYR